MVILWSHLQFVTFMLKVSRKPSCLIRALCSVVSTLMSIRYIYESAVFVRVTRVVGMDCEMVGVGDDGKESIVARVSMVNQYGACIYDKFVRPTERVTDYRTKVSGVRRADLLNGMRRLGVMERREEC